MVCFFLVVKHTLVSYFRDCLNFCILLFFSEKKILGYKMGYIEMGYWVTAWDLKKCLRLICFSLLLRQSFF